jgi:hypothetical protein
MLFNLTLQAGMRSDAAAGYLLLDHDAKRLVELWEVDFKEPCMRKG